MLTEKRKVDEEQPNPATAHQAITTVRRPDNTRSAGAMCFSDDRCPGHHCMQVCICATQLLQGVHMCSCMYSMFIRFRGRGWRGFNQPTSLCRALVSWRAGLSAWRGGLSLTEGEMEGFSCIFSIFEAGGSLRVYVCVYISRQSFSW